MFKLLQKSFPLFNAKKYLATMATGLLIFANSHATEYFVNDASQVGDALTTAIGDDSNPGTAALPFATLVFAITAAANGDTIYVDAGTYVTGDIIVNKSLAFRGVKFGIAAGPAATPINRGTNEAIIQGSLYFGQSRDNISVDGFTFDVGTALRGIEARGLNSVIINNILTGTITPLAQQQGISTRANAPGRIHSYLISRNNVRGFRFGIYMDGNTDNPSEVSLNYVTQCFTEGFTFTASDGHRIRANVSDNNSQGMVFSEGSNFIDQNTLINNVLIGIRLAGNALLSGNLLVNNFFIDNGVGVALTENNAGATNNSANFNSFTGNSLNIGSTHSANFNAQCNWFGTINPAAIAGSITGNVTFTPFLIDGTDTDPILDGFQPLAGTCIVTPVVLMDFSASAKNYNVQLRWATSQEMNSSHFVVERSFNNRDFVAIGQVTARGFSNTETNYTFVDDKPENFDRPTYYRLNMVDRDNSKKLSPIVNVTLKTVGAFVQSVYPNPVKAGTVLNVDYISDSKQSITFSLVSASGQILMQRSQAIISGLNRVRFTIPADIATGVIFLRVTSASGNKQVPVSIR